MASIIGPSIRGSSIKGASMRGSSLNPEGLGSDFLSADNPNLIVHYGSALDAGDLDDLSENGLEATLTGTTAGAGNGRIYDGVSDKAVKDTDWSARIGTEWTLSFFAKKESEFTAKHILSLATNNTSNTNNQIAVNQNSTSNLLFFIRNTALDTVSLNAAFAVADGETHFSLERDGSDWELYKDDVLVDSATVSFGATSLNRLVLGAIYSDASNTFVGFANADLGQFRLYGIKVDSSERTELFEEGA